MLDPAPTNSQRTILYNTYDVTSHLQAGPNMLGALLGNGWSGSPRLSLHLRLDFADGTSREIYHRARRAAGRSALASRPGRCAGEQHL